MSAVGFTMHRVGATRVWLRDDLASVLRSAGLADPAVWEARLADAPRAESGRGAVARVALPGGGPRLVLKRLSRGGRLAPVWRGRFAGIGRILANLTLPERAVLSGVATPRVAALVAISGPPGLWQGRLAVEEIPNAVDLRARLRRGPLDQAEMEAVARVLRSMHAAGLEHRDLNLGNLVLCATADGPRAHVLDLDGARYQDEPLSFSKRQRALRRLERSCRRVLGARAGAGAAEGFYAAYAGSDGELAARLAAGRARGRAWLGLRSLGRTERKGE